MPDPASLDWLRLLSAFTIALSIICGTWFIRRQPIGTHSTVSQHLAALPVSYTAVAAALTLGGAIVYDSMFFWLIPTYALPIFSYLIVVVLFAAQLIITWIPDNGIPSTAQRIHIFSAWVLTISVVLLLLTLASAVMTFPVVSAWMITISLLFSIVCLLLYVFVKSTHKHILVYEGVFIAIFFLAILSLFLKI